MTFLLRLVIIEVTILLRLVIIERFGCVFYHYLWITSHGGVNGRGDLVIKTGHYRQVTLLFTGHYREVFLLLTGHYREVWLCILLVHADFQSWRCECVS